MSEKDYWTIIEDWLNAIKEVLEKQKEYLRRK